MPAKAKLRTVAGPLWLVYLLCGSALIVAYYLVPGDRVGCFLRVATYCLVSISSVVAVWVGVRRNRPRPKLPWLLLGASQLVYFTGDATFYFTHYVLNSKAFPAAADALYLAHYPLVLAGLLLLIRRRTPGRDLPGLVDASVLAVVAALLLWLFLIAPTARFDSPTLAKVTSLAYPVMDLALLAMALRLMLGVGRRPPSFFLLSANLLAFFTADTVYSYQQLMGAYHAGNPLDAIWLGGELALGAAALHPSMNRLAERSPTTDTGLSPVRVAALFVAALVAPAILLIQDIRGSLQDVPVTATACALLFALTLIRMTGLVAGQRRLAITDALTGLRTRRFLEAQLPVEIARARRTGGSVALFIVDVDHFKSVNDRYGHPAGDRALAEIANRLRAASREGDVLARYGGEEFALLSADVATDELALVAERLRARVADAPIQLACGSSVAVTVSVGTASCPLHTGAPTELVAMADRALYRAKSQGRDRVVVGDSPEAMPTTAAVSGDQVPMVDFLQRVADEIDGWMSSYEHSQAIGRWVSALSVEMGHDRAVTLRAGLAGRLHDIGKIVVPRDILTKPRALSDEEWALLRHHPYHGARLALVVPGFERIADIIGQHHERFDGSGYPNHLAGGDILLEARILAVCDSWAAMRSDRPYQMMLTEDQAREQVRKGRGSQFDPDVADLFLDLHSRGLVGDLRQVRPNGQANPASVRAAAVVSPR